MKKHAKELFFNNLEFNIADAKNSSPRKYWQLVKMLVKENTKSCEQIPPLLIDNETYTNNENEIANALNDYIVSVATVNDEDSNYPPLSLKTNQILDEIMVSEQVIIDILSNLDINKASGPDGISHKMLKHSCNSICKPLSLLFNQSLRESQYPNAWKIANVIPLFKKGNKELPSNYRPISLISCLGKVMERVVDKYVFNFLLHNDLFHKTQSGFLRGHSTIYQHIDIYNQQITTCVY